MNDGGAPNDNTSNTTHNEIVRHSYNNEIGAGAVEIALLYFEALLCMFESNYEIKSVLELEEWKQRVYWVIIANFIIQLISYVFVVVVYDKYLSRSRSESLKSIIGCFYAGLVCWGACCWRLLHRG